MFLSVATACYFLKKALRSLYILWQFKKCMLPQNNTLCREKGRPFSLSPPEFPCTALVLHSFLNDFPHSSDFFYCNNYPRYFICIKCCLYTCFHAHCNYPIIIMQQAAPHSSRVPGSRLSLGYCLCWFYLSVLPASAWFSSRFLQHLKNRLVVGLLNRP